MNENDVINSQNEPDAVAPAHPADDLDVAADTEFATDAMFASDEEFSVDDWLPDHDADTDDADSDMADADSDVVEPADVVTIETGFGRRVDLDVEPESEPAAEIYSSGDHDLDASRAIEAIVMVSSDPVSEELLSQIVEMPVHTVQRLCLDLALSYEAEHRGFVFVKVAGGWRYQTHVEVAPYIERYVLEGQTARMSAAAMETLAIVAYKQPISRAQMSSIRGVNVDGVLRTLLLRGYVEEVGRDAGPGQAVLFGTTAQFLERLGLASTAQLPPLGEFVPGAHVVEALEQTLMNDLQVPLPLDTVAASEPTEPTEPVSQWLPVEPDIDLTEEDEAE